MAAEQFANRAQTTLSAAIDSLTTTVSVTSFAGFPVAAQYRLLVDQEYMLVTAGAGTATWTVTRGVEGSSAATHAAGAPVELVLTAGALGGQSDPAATVPGLRSLGTGAQQAMAGNTMLAPADGSISTAKLADGAVTAVKIAAATITDAQVAAANKDGIATTASLRTLGTGAQQAMAGNAAPNAHESSHRPGGSDAIPEVNADGLQKGVVNAGGFALTINSSSSIAIAAGIRWCSESGLLLRQTVAASTTLSGIPVATNARLDQVVVDRADGTVKILQGSSDASGNSLANRNGAASLTAQQHLLHDLLVTASGVTAANVRDRRPWARGALYRSVKTNASATTTSTTMVAADPTLLQARIECSGVPVRVTFNATGQSNTAGDGVVTGLQVDGSAVDGVTNLGAASGTLTSGCGFSYPTVPTAGSHLFTVTFAVNSGGTATLNGTAAFPCALLIAEEVRQNANNGTT